MHFSNGSFIVKRGIWCKINRFSLDLSTKMIKNETESGERLREAGEIGMSMEAMEQVTEAERQARERRAAADAQAQRIREEAEQAGRDRLAQVQAQAAEAGKTLLRQAEDRAAERAETIRRKAEEDAEALRKAAETHLADAAEFIVGRVVSH